MNKLEKYWDSVDNNACPSEQRSHLIFQICNIKEVNKHWLERSRELWLVKRIADLLMRNESEPNVITIFK